MAYSKASEFTEADIEAARIAKALSHPARIAILKLLAKKEMCICNTFVEELPLAQSTVSQHLAELKEAGLINGDADGPRVCYCLNTKVCKNAMKMFESLFGRLKCCWF